MKKILFSLMLLGVAFTVIAQDVTVYTTNKSGVPPYIKANFETAYPGVTVLTWEPVDPYWRAMYKKDNRVVYVFYDERGVNYRASLPVIQNNVPENVVTTALTVHGPIVYGITKMRSAGDSEVYQLRLLENGATKIVWMNADGTAATDVFKAKDGMVVTPKIE